EFSRIIKAMPDDIGILLKLADSSRELGRDDEALESYRKVLDQDPYEEHAKKYVESMAEGDGAPADELEETLHSPFQDEVEPEMPETPVMDEDSTMVLEAPVFGAPPAEPAPEAPAAAQEPEPAAEDEDATMVMQAPAFDVVTSEGAEETAAYEAPTEMELEIEEEGQQDSGIAGYDENPDGDMFLGEIDMEPEMPEMPDIEEEKPGIGTDEPTSGGGLEPGAMDMGQEEIVEEYEVGEIELAGSEESEEPEEPEEYEAHTGLEMAAERVAEEVFVEGLAEDADMTMVMEAPVFDEPFEEADEEVAADDEADETYEKKTHTIEPPSAETYEEVEEEATKVMEPEAVEAVEEVEEATKVMEPPAAQEVAGEDAGVETMETMEPVNALVEPDPEAMMEADRFIETGDYIKAMDVYNAIREKAPDSGPVLQSVQELKLLMKVHGQEG
ncbi:hypothetical protein LCGC14_2675600, partial [marine sediment metagenome]